MRRRGAARPAGEERQDGGGYPEQESEDETWARQRRAGEPAWRIAALLAIASYQRAGGPTEQVTATVEELTSRPPRTFEQFARDHAASFRG